MTMLGRFGALRLVVGVVVSVGAHSATAGKVDAQTVTGRAVNEAGVPVAGASVGLRHAEGRFVTTSVTSEVGAFVLRATLGGVYNLEVRHLGYADFISEDISIDGGENVEIEVRLGTQAIPLEPLTVLARRSPTAGRLAGFRQRMTDPGRVGGHFITREDIEARPMSTPSNLVLGVPGTTVAPVGGAFGLDRSLITLQGRGGPCVARLFVDGIRVTQTAQHTVDDLLDMETVGAVEVYPRALTAPMQYQDAGAAQCGVVLFWSREGERSSNPWSLKRIAIGSGIIGTLLFIGLAFQGSPPG